MKSAILDAGTLSLAQQSLGSLKALLPKIDIYTRTPAELTLERAKDCEVLLVNKVVLDSPILEKLPKLKYIGVIATGMNNVDLEYAKERGIVVKNAVGYSTHSVAQMVFAYILHFFNQLPEYSQGGRDWHRSQQFCIHLSPIYELKGKTLGIIGYGDIARKVHQLASAFEMNVLVSASLRPGSIPNRSDQPRTPLTELLKESDIVTLHCPLTPQTKHLVNKSFLNNMKPSAYLINTSRGPVVDENSLLEALSSKTLAGAALDVLSTEPPPSNHPLMRYNAPNLLITPHVAWASKEAQMRLLDITCENLRGYLEGSIK